jgi:hypothetical protein
MADTFNDTITKLRSEIEGHVAAIKGEPSWAQIEKLYRALGTIEELADQPRTSLVELFGISDGAGRDVRVRQGEFYGLEPLEAAKRFLKKKGEAASLDVILAGLETGGVKADKDLLRKSLSRSTWEIAKVGEDLYGLLEFYPHVKRGKKKTVGVNGGAAVTDAATPVGTVPVIVATGEEDGEEDEPTGT